MKITFTFLTIRPILLPILFTVLVTSCYPPDDIEQIVPQEQVLNSSECQELPMSKSLPANSSNPKLGGVPVKGDQGMQEFNLKPKKIKSPFIPSLEKLPKKCTDC